MTDLHIIVVWAWFQAANCSSKLKILEAGKPISNPLLLALKSGAVRWDLRTQNGMRDWAEAPASPVIPAISQDLGSSTTQTE